MYLLKNTFTGAKEEEEGKKKESLIPYVTPINLVYNVSFVAH